MATDKNTLKNWFKTGLKPLQTHFWAWLDSYWHKDDKIPVDSIDGIDKILENKADASVLDAKANADASGLSDDNVAKWKEALGVGEVPDNMATIDKDGALGNVHTKEQIEELLENSGKNIGNSDLKVPEGEERTLDLTGASLLFKGVQSAQGDASFNKRPKFKSDGTFGMVEENVVIKEDLKNAVKLFSLPEKTEFLKQFSGGFSTQMPSVSVIVNPVLVKGGIQNIKIVGANLSLDPDVSYVRFKKKSDTQVWHSVENYTCLSSNVMSANINTELMEVGQAYVFEIKHGLFLYTSVFSIDVVDEFTSVDISNLSWSEVKDAASDTYIQVSRSGNSFNVNNLKGAEPNLRNTVFHRFKSDKILNAGENAIISFGINVNYGAGVFEFPNGEFDNIGIGEYIADETLLVGRSSTIKSYFLGGGKPVNLRLQNNKHIIGGVGTGLIVKKGTQLISILQVENSSLYMEVNLLKDIDLAVEFQAVGRYLGAKNVGTYTLESVYKF